MYIMVYLMFSHSQGQVSYFLAVGQCLDVFSCQHTYSMHSTAYPAAKGEKTCLQEMDCVYSMRIMPYSMRIMLYTSIYHPLLRIRLEQSC